MIMGYAFQTTIYAHQLNASLAMAMIMSLMKQPPLPIHASLMANALLILVRKLLG